MKSTSKTKFSSKKKSLVIISIILAVVLAVGGFFAWKFFFKKTSAEVKKVYGEVTRGTVTNVIEGTGTVEAISQYEITSLAKGDVIADYFEEGDYVTKDQLLYEIDSASIDKSIEKQKTNVEKAQTNYNDSLENISKLSVKSDVSGVVTEVYVEVGDNVQQGGKIADVINKDTLKVTVPFGEADAVNIKAGDSASVTLSKSLTALDGWVKRVATGSYANSYGAVVTDVEIEFTNPGSVLEGESASAVIGEYACYDTASVSYNKTKTITAEASGEIKVLSINKGDKVYNGQTVAQLESKSAEKSSRDAQLSLNDANLSLEDLYDNLEDYSIKSPIDGKVIQKNIKAGEKLETNSSTSMAVIADLSKLTFDMSIDELDITKISVGQKVTITADALPNQRFNGEISNISIIGSAYQGVTSYPVTVTIDNTVESDLIPGMNVSAQIIVDSAEDVLLIPVSAVHMGNLVIVKDDGTFLSPAEAMKAEMASFGKEKNDKKTDAAENGKPEGKGDEAPQQGGNSGEKPQRGEFGNNGERPDMSGFDKMGGEKPDMSGFNKENREKPDVNNIEKGDNINEKMPQSGEEKKEPEKSSEPKKMNGEDFNKMAEERMKAMIENLDVPEGYTVVRVETGLTDGAFIEIKEKEGSLKLGDKIVLNEIVSNNTNQTQGMSGMGGMPMGGMGNRSMGGMPMGGMGNRSMGGMSGGNRQGGWSPSNR